MPLLDSLGTLALLFFELLEIYITILVAAFIAYIVVDQIRKERR
jgi:hypothetical protein